MLPRCSDGVTRRGPAGVRLGSEPAWAPAFAGATRFDARLKPSPRRRLGPMLPGCSDGVTRRAPARVRLGSDPAWAPAFAGATGGGAGTRVPQRWAILSLAATPAWRTAHCQPRRVRYGRETMRC